MADIVRPGEAAGGPLNRGAMPKNYDLEIYKGDYFELVFVLKDNSGNPVPLFGAEVEAQLRSNYDDATPIDFECTLTGNPGEVNIFLSSDDSELLEPGSYIWDFQITTGAGRTRTYLTGDVTVYDEVTQ